MKPTAEARGRFFNESGEMLPPFVSPDWRGCALDRDRYDNTRIPQILFEAIAGAASPAEIFVCGYFQAGKSCTPIAPTWHSYRSHLLNQDNWSLEYVVYDSSQRWALLADGDATIFGADPALASAVDSYLAEHGTSLIQLTDSEFPGLSPEQPGAKYLLAVSGR